MQVRDFMIRNVISAKHSTTVKELISILETNRIGGVPVVDDKGNLVGTFQTGISYAFFHQKTSEPLKTISQGLANLLKIF